MTLILLILAAGIGSAQGNDIKVLPPLNGVYHTAYSGIYTKKGIVPPEEVSHFRDLAGKNIVWLNFNNDWFGGIKFPAESVRNISSQNVVPSIRVMPWSFYNTNNEPVYSLKKILSGKFDKEIRQWARDARDSKIPLIVDFAPEANGDWFPWSGVHNGAGGEKYGNRNIPDGPELYRDAFRYFVDIFNEENADNITWMFHVNSDAAPHEKWNEIKNYYPGDEYVDWIGVNIYGPQKWGDPYRRFMDILDGVYVSLCGLSGSKPIAVVEFGVADYLPGINKAVWVQSALYTVTLPEYSRIKAVGWWNSTWLNHDGTMSALQIDSSPQSLLAYRESIAQPFFVENIRMDY